MNPFFGTNQVKQENLTSRQIPTISEINLNSYQKQASVNSTKFEEFLNNSSIYSSLDEYDYIINNYCQRTPSNGSIKAVCYSSLPRSNALLVNKTIASTTDCLHKNIDSLSIDTSTDMNIEDSLVDYKLEIYRKNELQAKQREREHHFRRSLSMTNTKRDRNLNTNKDTNQVTANSMTSSANIRKSNEYCEPFDLLSASLDLKHTNLHELAQFKSIQVEEQRYSSIELSQNTTKNMVSSGYFSSDARLNEWSEAEILSVDATTKSEVYSINKQTQIDKNLKCVISNDYETVNDLMLEEIKCAVRKENTELNQVS